MSKFSKIKSGIVPTIVTGAATAVGNAVVDGIIDKVAPSYASYADGIKVAAGILLRAFGKGNKYMTMAGDGLAIVGVANLTQDLAIDPLMDQIMPESTTAAEQAAAGLPAGTIGRARLGNGAYIRRHGKVAGLGSAFGK